MFKRVDKRRRRQQEEEELGIDGQLKQILGAQYTDSEESESDDDSDDDGGERSFAGLGGSGSDSEQGEEVEDEDHDGDEDEDDDAVPAFLAKLTIEQALREPILPIPGSDELNLCILCPHKSLRSEPMVHVHRSSNAHKRRLAQFMKHSKGKDPKELAIHIVEDHMQSEASAVAQPSEGKSKRALKKEASRARRKEIRQKVREKKKAKKASAATNEKATDTPNSAKETNAASSKSTKQKKDEPRVGQHKTSKADLVSAAPDLSTSPPKKKRRTEETEAVSKSASKTTSIQQHLAEPAPVATPNPSPKEKTPSSAPSIKSIARSATSRAKAALASSRKSKP